MPSMSVEADVAYLSRMDESDVVTAPAKIKKRKARGLTGLDAALTAFGDDYDALMSHISALEGGNGHYIRVNRAIKGLMLKGRGDVDRKNEAELLLWATGYRNCLLILTDLDQLTAKILIGFRAAIAECSKQGENEA